MTEAATSHDIDLLSRIEDRFKEARESQDRFSNGSQQRIDTLVKDARKIIEDSKEAALNFSSHAKKASSKRATRALAKVPYLRDLPGIKDTTRAISLKDAFIRSYESAQEAQKRLEAELLPHEEYAAKMEHDLQHLISVREEAVNSISDFKQQQESLRNEHEQLQSTLNDLQKGTPEYILKDTKLINIEQETRSLDKKIVDKKRVINVTDDCLDFLRGYAHILHNYLVPGRVLVDYLKQQADFIAPRLKQQAQLAQLGELADKAMEEQEKLRVTYNIGMLVLAEQGKRLGSQVAEITGGRFFLPEVVEKVIDISKEGHQEIAHREAKLLASPTGELGNSYMALNLPVDATIEAVHERYRYYVETLSPSSEEHRPNRIALAQIQSAYRHILKEKGVPFPDGILPGKDIVEDDS